MANPDDLDITLTPAAFRAAHALLLAKKHNRNAGYGAADAASRAVAEWADFTDDAILALQEVIGNLPESESSAIVADGIVDDTVALQAAVTAAATSETRTVRLPAGTIRTTATVLYNTGVTIAGAGREQTVIAFSGTGYAFRQTTPGTRRYDVTFRDFEIDYSAAGSGGIDLTDMSVCLVENVTVRSTLAGNGSAFRLAGAISGNCVYNTFRKCVVFSADRGYDIAALGSNDTHLYDCRAGGCTRGVSIVDSNHVVLDSCPLEGNTTGVYIEATSSSLADGNTIAHCRFEGNTANVTFGGTQANIRYPVLLGNTYFTGPVPAIGTVNRPQFFDAAGVLYSSSAVTEPFKLQRTVSGGSSLPALEVVDTVTSTGTPVTVQARNERGVGSFFRGVYSGGVRCDLAADGSLTLVAGITCTAISCTTLAAAGNVSIATNVSLFMGDGVTAGNCTQTYRKPSGNHTLVSCQLGTAASGLRWLEQWNSTTDLVLVSADDGTGGGANGALHAINTYRVLYSPFSGRTAFAVNRLCGNLGTTIVNGNWALSAGWGTTATAVVVGTAKTMRGRVTLTSAGTGQGANPTATLTFPEGTWAAAPEAMVIRNGGTGALVGYTFVATATTLVITMVGTPIAAETYTFSYSLMG